MAMLIGMPPKNIISPAILNHAATPAIASAVINVRIPNSIHIFIAILNSALWLWQIKLYINTSMIKLERVKNRVIADQNDPKHQLGHPLTGRGIIDSFLPSSEKTLYSFISDTTADTLGKRFIELAKQNDIHIATQFGVEGADLMSLLDADVDIEHTWFETSLINIKMLPRRWSKKLLDKYNFIIHDYVEGGTFLQYGTINPQHEIDAISLTPKNIVIATSGFKIWDDITTNHISIPMYAIYSYCWAKPNLAQKIAYKPSKTALVLCNKPRESRLLTLAKMHESGLLENSDWSCNINYNSTTKVFNGKQLSAEEVEQLSKSSDPKAWQGATLDAKDPNYNLVETFKKDHENVFPKALEGLDFVMDSKSGVYSDAFDYNPAWAGKYQYYIALETVHRDHNRKFTYTNGFVSDKTFKGFLTCSPVLSIGDRLHDSYLADLGFEVLDTGADESPYIDQKIDGVLNIIKKTPFMLTSKNKFIAEKNYNLITNEDFLCNLVIKPLKNLIVRQQ
jgi:hypothetical protein